MRAVHIEMGNDMTTNSFINCFRRFIRCQGKPKAVYSDNGTNFIGEDRPLRIALRDLNQSGIEGYFEEAEISWRCDPPSASYMGGARERTIHSIRRIHSALITKNHTLTNNNLQTFFVEMENF